ncbi:MAG: hypothetical protein LC623_09040 [Halobacteriales archaeon]|nr:hypothetical protein [Halobacteriales archaeon]
MDKLCSGGGSSILGWADYIEILGDSFHIANNPASSYTTVYKHPDQTGAPEGYVETMVEGNARSTLDDIEMVIVQGDETVSNHGHWSFANIPMGGALSVDSRCLLAAVSSTTFGASGFPLGAQVLNLATPVLAVRASGTTCLIPC